jgi:short-subunit dehydrogenase
MNTFIQNGPVVLISGCSSGIGRQLVKEFASRNYRVFATARRPAAIDDLKSKNVETLALDVTDNKSIKKCVKSVIDYAGRIDVLINNAGQLLIGPVAELEADELRHQFETNVIGLAALTREAARDMINRKSGMIVNMSSISGVLPTPFAGAYCSTKAALTALSDALRMELAPFGINVVIVQAGKVKSKLGENAAHDLDRFKGTPYGRVHEFILARAFESQQRATPAEEFAKKLVDRLERKKPPLLIRIGTETIRVPLVAWLFPRSLTDLLLRKRFGLKRF